MPPWRHLSSEEYLTVKDSMEYTVRVNDKCDMFMDDPSLEWEVDRNRGMLVKHHLQLKRDSLVAELSIGDLCCMRIGMDAQVQSDTLFLTHFNQNETVCKCVCMYAVVWKGSKSRYSHIHHVLFRNLHHRGGWEELEWH